VIALPSPTEHSQDAYRRSARVSFFEKFIDSRLSDILEFEDDTLSLLATETESEFQSDFATKLLTSCLGPEARLSNGCTDNENFPVKIPCPGGVLNCFISSSLVSAMVCLSLILPLHGSASHRLLHPLSSDLILSSLWFLTHSATCISRSNGTLKNSFLMTPTC
jgi:hypothetical protein